MYCPSPSCQQSTDRPRLVISERSGIEIDYCPQCRGVWLDRGELDKLIERAQADVAQDTPQQMSPPTNTRTYSNQHQAHYPQEHHYQDAHHKNQHYGHYGKYKKKSILSDIFDF